VATEQPEHDFHYQTLFRQAPLGIFHYDLDGVLVDVNDQFAAIIGSSRDTLLGMNMLERLGDKAMKAAIRQSLSHGSARYEGEYRSVTADKVTPVRVILNGILGSDGQVVSGIGIVEDFSDRRAAEKALQYSEDLLQRTMAVARVGGWELSLPDMNLHWSDTLRALHEVSDDFEPEVETALNFYPEGVSRDRIRQAVQCCIDLGRPFDEEVHFNTATGKSLWVRVVGEREKDSEGRQRLIGVMQDVSEARQILEAARRRKEVLQHAANNVPGVIYQLRWEPTDGQVSMPYASAKLQEVLGVTHETVLEDASELLDRIHPMDASSIGAAMEISRVELKPFNEQFRLLFPEADGQTHRQEWIEAISRPERQPDGGVIWHGFASRITERKQLEDELKQQVYFDSLTGLPNRVLVQDRAHQAVRYAERHGEEVALMHIDLDGFKDINDAWGHGFGDKLLRQVAHRLTGVMRESDTLGRLGGDEFVVVAEESNGGDDAAGIAGRISEALNKPFELGTQNLRATASIGISLYPSDGRTPEDLLRHADAALYRAKAKGTGQWAWYKPELTDAALERRYLESELRSALELGEIQAALQPVVSLASGEVVGYEALARWHHQQEGWVSPGLFIPVAESRGLIDRLGEQVHQKAFARFMGLPEREGRYLAVNVAPRQLQDSSFVGRFAALIQESGIPPHKVEVEITEQVFMGDPSEPLRQLSELRELGVRVSIDDFGTGFSSLSYLRQLPIDRLKIDMTFVREVDQRPDNQAIVNTIMTLAREFNLLVTAEGIETEGEAEHLRKIGCEYAQGFFYGKPMLDPDIGKAEAVKPEPAKVDESPDRS